MENDFKTANITYKGLEDKGPTVRLTDSNDQKWVIWKKAYQSEEDSEAYGSLQNFKFGEIFGVSYLERDKSFVVKEGKDKGKTINFKERTIYSLTPPVAETPNPKPYAPFTPKGISNGNIEVLKDDQQTFWDKKAYKQCLWNYWLATDRLNTLSEAQRDVVWQVFNQIDQDANKRFDPLNTDLDVDSIPF